MSPKSSRQSENLPLLDNSDVQYDDKSESDNILKKSLTMKNRVSEKEEEESLRDTKYKNR